MTCWPRAAAWKTYLRTKLPDSGAQGPMPVHGNVWPPDTVSGKVGWGMAGGRMYEAHADETMNPRARPRVCDPILA